VLNNTIAVKFGAFSGGEKAEGMLSCSGGKGGWEFRENLILNKKHTFPRRLLHIFMIFRKELTVRYMILMLARVDNMRVMVLAIHS
jgi:hypothetical protein